MKENRALFEAWTPPLRQVPVAHTATDRCHSRITIRTIQILLAPDDRPFLRVSQVYLIERHITDLNGEPLSEVAALGAASPAPDRLNPPVLPHASAGSGYRFAVLARDTLYQEDKSQVRSRSGPRIMAALRNWRSVPSAYSAALMAPKQPDWPAGPLRVNDLLGEDPLVSVVPPLLGGVPKDDVDDVDQLFVFALLVPDLPVGAARVGQDDLCLDPPTEFG